MHWLSVCPWCADETQVCLSMTVRATGPIGLYGIINYQFVVLPDPKSRICSMFPWSLFFLSRHEWIKWEGIILYIFYRKLAKNNVVPQHSNGLGLRPQYSSFSATEGIAMGCRMRTTIWQALQYYYILLQNTNNILTPIPRYLNNLRGCGLQCSHALGMCESTCRMSWLWWTG